MPAQLCGHFLFVGSEEGTDFYATDGAVVGADTAPRAFLRINFGKIVTHDNCLLRTELFALFTGDTAADTFFADGRALFLV